MSAGQGDTAACEYVPDIDVPPVEKVPVRLTGSAAVPHVPGTVMLTFDPETVPVIGNDVFSPEVFSQTAPVQIRVPDKSPPLWVKTRLP